jgi:hypothetical protein
LKKIFGLKDFDECKCKGAVTNRVPKASLVTSEGSTTGMVVDGETLGNIYV